MTQIPGKYKKLLGYIKVTVNCLLMHEYLLMIFVKL